MSKKAKPVELLDACTDDLSARGPDDRGRMQWDWSVGEMTQVGLGHRRLAIFDLSDAGRQPMGGRRGLQIVFNGEVFNWPELRTELESIGHKFNTRTDTEVVLAAYAEWGPSCVERFNGMWAFAIFDPEGVGGDRGLFLCRDRLGIKPLYYIETDEGICFASEIRPLFRFLGRQPVVCPAKLADMVVLQRQDWGGETVYAGVKELRGGNWAWLNPYSGRLMIRRYWDLPEHEEPPRDDEAVLDEFEELFGDAVRLRLRADVDVALTLSGGVDSSCVAVAAGRGDRSVAAFTSTFPGRPEIDESGFAREVCKTLGLEHVPVAPGLHDLASEVPSELARQELPITGLSSFVHAAVLGAVRDYGMRVCVCGQGADELFLGYERYFAAWMAAAGGAREKVRCWWQARKHSRLSGARLLAIQGYFRLTRPRRRRYIARARQWFCPNWVEQARADLLPMPSDLAELQRSELLAEGLPLQLRLDDRTSAGLGMELRVPFLDYRLVEFAWRLPWQNKIREGWTKHLLRRYLARHGLESIAWRRDKLGFNAPTADWTREVYRARRSALHEAPARHLLRCGRLPEDVPFVVYNLLELSHQLRWDESVLN